MVLELFGGFALRDCWCPALAHVAHQPRPQGLAEAAMNPSLNEGPRDAQLDDHRVIA